MTTTFELVSFDDELGMIVDTFTAENVIDAIEFRGFEFVKLNENSKQRAELQGAPVFSGLCGPMYGGPGKVRYEAPAAYERLSQ